MEYNPSYNLKIDSIRNHFIDTHKRNTDFLATINLVSLSSNHDYYGKYTILKIKNHYIEKYGVREHAEKGSLPWSKWKKIEWFEGTYWELKDINYKKLVLFIEEHNKLEYSTTILYGEDEYIIGDDKTSALKDNHISHPDLFYGQHLVRFIRFLIEKGSRFSIPQSLIESLDLLNESGFQNHFDHMLEAKCYTEFYDENQEKEGASYHENGSSPNLDFSMDKISKGNTFNQGEEIPISNHLLKMIAEFIVKEQSVATSVIQKKFGIGYDKATRHINKLVDLKIIGPFLGAETRKVYVKSMEELEKLFDNN